MQTPEEPFDVKVIEKNSSLVLARDVSCWRTRYHQLNRAKVVLKARYTCETVNPDTQILTRAQSPDRAGARSRQVTRGAEPNLRHDSYHAWKAPRRRGRHQ